MKPLARLPFALGFAGATFVASQASAHVRLVYPTPRYATPAMMGSSTDIKVGPCGRMGDARTTDMSRVTVLEPGATITVQFNETIDHPGFYRISFDDDGQDAFVAPTTRAMVQTGPTFTLPVLLDNIADHAAGMYTAMVTLPNVECERCTLQLIQVMVATGVMSWTATGADPDIYFTCADIALRRAGGGGGAGGMGGAGGASAGSAGSGVSGAGGSADAGAGGLPQSGAGGASGAVSAGSGGLATGGALPAGGSAGAPEGGTAGTTASGGGAPGAGAPAGGGVPAGGATPAPAAAATEEEGGCSILPARSGGEALTAAVLALFGVLVRRRRGSRSAVA